MGNRKSLNRLLTYLPQFCSLLFASRFRVRETQLFRVVLELDKELFVVCCLHVPSFESVVCAVAGAVAVYDGGEHEDGHDRAQDERGRQADERTVKSLSFHYRGAQIRAD
jgi:hypothetical protein